MSGYVLYFPQARGCDPEQLTRAGIGGLKEGSISFADCLNGPDGSIGTICHWSLPNKPVALGIDRYNWTPAVPDGELPAGRFFIGIPIDGVSPADIQRKEVQPGWTMRLLDGNEWTIPAAAMLPHRHALDANGEHTRTITDRFKDYWEQSQQYAEQFFTAIDGLLEAQQRAGIAPAEIATQFTLADTWKFCVTALSINYRLNADLVSILGLLDDTAMANICKAACDLPTLIKAESQKKTESVTIPVGLSI